MQPPATESTARDVPDFAGLLSALTAPSRKREPSWSDEDLAEDVATLSYESALRTHARPRPVDHFESALTPPGPSGSARASSPLAARLSASIDKDRKSASITIRVSQAECDQLHRRAAEAGLTMSAYLRSCTLEAEALRAQVKQALAEMRKAGTEGPRDQGNEETKRQSGEEASERENQSKPDPESETALRQSAAASRLARVFHPIRGLGTRLLHRRP